MSRRAELTRSIVGFAVRDVSGGWGQGDGVAEGLELAGEVVGAVVAVDAAGVEVGA